MKKRVKIVATVGPSCEKKISKLIAAGVDCVRINTAYRDVAYYERIIRQVRKTGDTPILLDLKGSDIRLRLSKDTKVDRNDTLRIGFGSSGTRFTKSFAGSVKKGDAVSFKDGRISSRIVSKNAKGVLVKFSNSGTLYDGIGVNIPKPLKISPLLSSKDRAVIKIARKLDVEYVALSFTKTKQDVLTLRRALKDKTIKIIAKIESKQALDNIQEIIDVSDGVMVARGDLGIELPDELVPVIQKEIIQLANDAGKIVITATEMLESMIDNDGPTRAETSDVANAILDGTDAVMLSGETATGKHPIEVVREMVRISKATENYVEGHVRTDEQSISELITGSVSYFCTLVDLNAVVTITRSGYTTRMISRFRNNEPLIAVTREAKVARQLRLVYAAIPVHYPKMPKTDQMKSVLKYLVKTKHLTKKSRVAVTAGILTKKHGTNSVTLVDVEDVY